MPLRALALCLICLWPAMARAEPEVIPFAYPMSAPLQAREASLRAALEAQGRHDKSRYWLGGVLTTLGAGFIAIGAVYPYEAGPFFIPFGSQAVLRGVLSWVLLDDSRPWQARYEGMPMTTPDQIRARIGYGEQALARLAYQYRRTRIIDGVVSLLVAAAYVPMRYGLSRGRDPGYRFGDDFADYLLLGLSSVQAINGVVTFFDRTSAETAHKEYRALVDAQERVAPGALQHLSFGITPLKNGAAWTARASF